MRLVTLFPSARLTRFRQASAAAARRLALAAEEATIEVVSADLTDAASIAALANQIDKFSLDVIVVNAGIIGSETGR